MSKRCRKHCAELRRNEQAVQPGNRITTRFATERHTRQKGSIPFARSKYRTLKPCFYRAFSFGPNDFRPSRDYSRAASPPGGLRPFWRLRVDGCAKPSNRTVPYRVPLKSLLADPEGEHAGNQRRRLAGA